jgi:hypothetical protein
MTFDPWSVILGFLAAVLTAYPAWLFGWGAKHFHDAFVLPLIRDWWARRNAKAALQMAEAVLLQLEGDMRAASDVRHLILHVYRMLSAAVLSSALFMTLFLMLLFFDRFSTERGTGTANLPSLLLLAMVAAVYALWLFVGVRFEYKKTAAMFLNLAEHRAATISRLKTLLVAADLNDDQVQEWLDRVPPLPSHS